MRAHASISNEYYMPRLRQVVWITRNTFQPQRANRQRLYIRHRSETMSNATKCPRCSEQLEARKWRAKAGYKATQIRCNNSNCYGTSYIIPTA